jgi:hypothetical protein
MSGSCWRLLGVFSLIFVVSIFVAPAFVRGQDASADRAPVLAPNLPMSRRPSTMAPTGIPPPSLPWRYPPGSDPVAPGSVVFQQNVLQQLVRSAGIIFSGRVTFIGHAASSPGPNPASTTVTFQVEHALRGASPGSLTIHEWAGLWTSGERYRVGERVLLFLYAPGKLGLTSPVAGAMGKFAMDSEGKIVMGAQHVATLAADPILGGKTVVTYADFALAVRRSSREE